MAEIGSKTLARGSTMEYTTANLSVQNTQECCKTA
jgi:hypothetical protein